MTISAGEQPFSLRVGDPVRVDDKGAGSWVGYFDELRCITRVSGNQWNILVWSPDAKAFREIKSNHLQPLAPDNKVPSLVDRPDFNQAEYDRQLDARFNAILSKLTSHGKASTDHDQSDELLHEHTRLVFFAQPSAAGPQG